MLNNTDKIVWAEGVLLGQQHFQQWDNYWQFQLNTRLFYLVPHGWGIIKLEIDEDALLSGQFCLNACQAVFANGLLVNYDAARDGFLLSCNLRVDNQSQSEIFLAIPNGQYISGIAGYDTSDQLPVRKAHYRNVYDLYDTKRQREVMFGKLNLQLLQSGDALESFSYLKIAEIENIDSNQFKLVAGFVPPALFVSAVPRLGNIVRGIVAILAAKIRILTERDCEKNGPDNILLLQTLRSSQVHFQHQLTNGSKHPEQLFLILSDLASRLSVFTTDCSLLQLPNYRHENPAVCFEDLNKLLLQLLESAMPSNLQTIKLRRMNESLYLADNIDTSIFSRCDLFIGVYFVADDSKWIDQFILQVKVGSQRVIEKLVTSAVGGIRILHRQRPPHKLNIKSGYEYFYLEPQNSYWNEVKDSQNLGIFIPGAFNSAIVELVIVEK